MSLVKVAMDSACALYSLISSLTYLLALNAQSHKKEIISLHSYRGLFDTCAVQKSENEIIVFGGEAYGEPYLAKTWILNTDTGKYQYPLQYLQTPTSLQAFGLKKKSCPLADLQWVA